jgi:hypothetical protein
MRRERASMAVVIALNNREKQPHDVSGGAREHRTTNEERTGYWSEHGGALKWTTHHMISIAINSSISSSSYSSCFRLFFAE